MDIGPVARRVARLPKTRAAIEAGVIGFESATLLARVASGETEDLWLDRAIISTTKIFREHVDAAELHARVEGHPLRGLRPPSPDELEAARELERRVLATVFAESSGDIVFRSRGGGEPTNSSRCATAGTWIWSMADTCA